MLALASIVGTMSGAVDLQGLVTNPPFGSNAAQTTTADPAQALEFRGTFVDGNERFFSIRETATRSSQWVGLKESGQPFLVESYDNAKGSIQVKFRNQVMTLSLKQAQIIVQAAPSPASAPTPMPPGSTIANSTPSNEANRLAQVAEEIRRRRALRSPGLLPPQYSAASNPPRPGPVPQQNVTGNPQYSGPMPQQNTAGNPRSGPMPQITTGNPPDPGPVPTNP